jgi:hypothetical protein
MKLRNYPFIFSMALLGILAGCVQPIYLPTDFKEEARAYSVKGKQGWMINQRMNFAEFTTSKVDRGWTSTYNIPFVVTFKGGKEKIAFTLYDADSSRAEVMALSKLRSQEIALFSEFFSIPLKYENTFTGAIFNPSDTAGWWNFAILNPDESWGKKYQSTGFAVSRLGQKIEIKAIKQLQTKRGPSVPSVENYGFAFWFEGRMLGAVSVINNGQVWLHNSLNKNQRLMLSALAAAVMLRQNLTENVENQ